MMTYKEEAIINKAELFDKIAHREKSETYPEVVKSINNRKKAIKEMITERLGKVNLRRKPSALKLMEKGMKQLFFGTKGIVTKRVAPLEKELIKTELQKKSKLENKIFIGSMPFLTLRDTTKLSEVLKNNDTIRRQLMRSNNYTLIVKKPLFTSNRVNSKEESKRMNTTHTANEMNLCPFQTGLSISGKRLPHNSNKKKENYNRTFYKTNTRKMIKRCNTIESTLQTSTSNSPIKNIKGISLNVTALDKKNVDRDNVFQSYQKASLLKDYNKTANAISTNFVDKATFTPRAKTNYQKVTNQNYSVFTQSLLSKIYTLNNSNNNVETNLINLIDSSNVQGSTNPPLINRTQLQTDYEIIFNRKMAQREQSITTKESIKNKITKACLLIDPIKAKMNELQSRIHKLTDKQAESYADDIASKYLMNKQNNIYKQEGVDYSNAKTTQSKEKKDMKIRLAIQNGVILKMRHNLIQKNIKLMEKFERVNRKVK